MAKRGRPKGSKNKPNPIPTTETVAEEPVQEGYRPEAEIVQMPEDIPERAVDPSVYDLSLGEELLPAGTEGEPVEGAPEEPAEEVQAAAEPEEKPEQEPEAPPEPMIDPALAGIARTTLGMGDEEIASFGTTKALAAAMRLLSRKGVGEAPPADIREPAKETDGLEPLKLDLGLPVEGEDAYDPKLVSAMHRELNKLSEHVERRVASLDGNLANQRRALEQQRAQEVHAQVEKWFDSQGSEWEEVFGKGPSNRLPPGSLQAQNRQKVRRDAGIRMAGLAQTDGETLPLIADLLEESRKSVFFDRCLEIERGKVLAELEKQRKQGTSPPTQRQGPPRTKMEELDQRLDQWYRDRGMEPDIVSSDVGYL